MSGSFRLFRVAGINVYLHWSWLIVAYFEVDLRSGKYTSGAWNVAEYLTLFGIVLLHEFGHSLACRQVGGVADRIVLWPLGGIAFVKPPPRPGAVLWSIAAGPLVNVVLLPIMTGLCWVSDVSAWQETFPDVDLFLKSIDLLNRILLVFNLLPIFPLDGGQIVQALLWFVIGRARSLMVVSVIGLLAGLGLLGLALAAKDWWFVIIAVFIAFRSWAGFGQARALARLAKAPRHQGFSCPSCGAAPLRGAFWVCSQCRQPFDTFESGAVCPQCGTSFDQTACPECHRRHPWAHWSESVRA